MPTLPEESIRILSVNRETAAATDELSYFNAHPSGPLRLRAILAQAHPPQMRWVACAIPHSLYTAVQGYLASNNGYGGAWLDEYFEELMLNE